MAKVQSESQSSDALELSKVSGLSIREFSLDQDGNEDKLDGDGDQVICKHMSSLFAIGIL